MDGQCRNSLPAQDWSATGTATVNFLFLLVLTSARLRRNHRMARNRFPVKQLSKAWLSATLIYLHRLLNKPTCSRVSHAFSAAIHVQVSSCEECGSYASPIFTHLKPVLEHQAKCLNPPRRRERARFQNRLPGGERIER
jgi:hypothetical protein